jgi:hypothetical protein
LKAARRSEANEADVIFSYIDGYVWMSWAGAVATVRVGQYQAATAGMRDFLAQCELGERLANGKVESPCIQAGRVRGKPDGTMS